VVGPAIAGLGFGISRWTAIRKASDPQIEVTLPMREQNKTAAPIHQKSGCWTTVAAPSPLGESPPALDPAGIQHEDFSILGC